MSELHIKTVKDYMPKTTTELVEYLRTLACVDFETGRRVMPRYVDDEVFKLAAELIETFTATDAEKIKRVMEQVQVFASTYSLVGGRFDDGSKFQQAEAEKQTLRAMLSVPIKAEKEIAAGRFEEWSIADFAGQCRMQSREQLDPEFSRFMAALGIRLAALASAIGGKAVVS